MDCNTCLSHVICMLFLAVIISTVLHGVLKTRTYHNRNVIFHVFMCVTQSTVMPFLYLTPFYLLLFAELQSYSDCQALFLFFVERKIILKYIMSLYSHM